MPAYQNSTADSLSSPWRGEASSCAFKAQRTAARQHACLSEALWQMLLHEPRAAVQAAQESVGQETQQGWTEYPRISAFPALEAAEENPETYCHDAVWRPSQRSPAP